MYLGAHVSIESSIAFAPERGRAVGADAIQIFSRSPRMLRRTKPLTPEETQGFKDNLVANGIARAVIHANYLINLGAAAEHVVTYSREAFVEELDRAGALGVRDVIFHPASHGGAGVENAIRTTAESLDWCFDHSNARDVFAVLENMAGQGTVIGHTFEELAAVIKGSANPDRLGVCIDTCHTFAAGYDFRAREGYDDLIQTVEGTVGLRHIRAFHLNDSKGDLGSRVDRHEDIGKGKLGKEAFRFLVNDDRFRETPGCLEFPGADAGYRKNLKVLRSLVTGPNPPTSPKAPPGKRAGRETGSGTGKTRERRP